MTTNFKPTLVVVAGPTASGKTGVAVRLARHYGTSVVSADSRQVYRGMAVGTAQPSREELNAAPHYFISCQDIDEPFTAGRFEEEGLGILRELFKKNRIVVMAGGSGLYIDALCKGFDPIPAVDPAIRAALAAELEISGPEPLKQELLQADPKYYAVADLNNNRRIIRALEIYRATGVPYSSLRSGTHTVRDFNIIKIGLELPRDILYERINDRVDHMVRNGLVDEARALFLRRELNALRTVGYTELFQHFEGKITLGEAIDLIKRNSRRYAKRQLTWFNRDPQIRWFSPDDTDKIINHIDSGLQC